MAKPTGKADSSLTGHIQTDDGGTENQVTEKLKMIVGGDNVFRDLGFNESEAQNLLLRTDLMIAIQRSIGKAGLSQTEAAKKLGVTQPRLSDLYRHRIQRFSLDALVTLAARAGLAVRMTVNKAA